MRTRSSSRKHRYRSSRRIREKARPKGREGYEVEIRLRRAIRADMPPGFHQFFPNHTSTSTDIENVIGAVRSMVGGRYKIIRHRKLYEYVTILLEREADLVFLSLLGRDLIHRAYRYV